MKTFQKDAFGYLAKTGNSKYFAISNKGSRNGNYRIRLSSNFITKISGIKSSTGFTTHTDKNSKLIKENELAQILKEYIRLTEEKVKASRIILQSGGFLVVLTIKNSGYGVLYKQLKTGFEYSVTDYIIGSIAYTNINSGSYTNSYDKITTSKDKDICDELKDIRKSIKELEILLKNIENKLDNI